MTVNVERVTQSGRRALTNMTNNILHKTDKTKNGTPMKE